MGRQKLYYVTMLFPKEGEDFVEVPGMTLTFENDKSNVLYPYYIFSTSGGTPTPVVVVLGKIPPRQQTVVEGVAYLNPRDNTFCMWGYSLTIWRRFRGKFTCSKVSVSRKSYGIYSHRERVRVSQPEDFSRVFRETPLKGAASFIEDMSIALKI
jgi:hypothetical protein